ncbi:bifunctional ADP-dependent NAD(P)H-hydrate dehydratase/NAD(P)H-hydrate epimerase [Novispirillum itersonii]|uniref:bifunctional ADP-dependent NAD(P)H-hydrate dehydratase/NAD(P)H-hydrate epimerase n=1 Tax=Novispirillum itersonii TaxID=189 RepID=UPI000373C84A|nr:bifunctional ADP-dependent NAD(P)H-hydrate dehydratase/NAD(P)H-hydrate epimerase [Novispirillum itersonii]
MPTLSSSAALAAVLTVDQMYDADRRTIAGGLPGLALMEAAGWAVAQEALRWLRHLPGGCPGQRGPVVVLCGPGNNGGDGFVAARLLAGRGYPVRLALSGDRAALRGDAAVMAGRWGGAVEPLDPALLDRAVLVIDALFGAGLSRPVDGVAAAVIDRVNALGLPCIAVDVPSGVQGDSGAILGVAPQCVATVTFFRAKPGHYLYPGRQARGALVVADIGIADRVLGDIAPQTFLNGPALWALPQPGWQDHKYARGHLVVLGGAEMTGAARLVARAARRSGAGLVTVAAPEETAAVYAADAPGTLVAPLAGRGSFRALLDDLRKTVYVLGPGGGVGKKLRRRVLAALAAGRHCVLDADALTSFAGDAETLFSAIAAASGQVVLTPHEGEFLRLFAADGPRLHRARKAARHSGAVVLLKGADTVVAAPDGTACITANAGPDLATAGSGDVLAGVIGGLLAQGMGGFAAAAAGAWLHAEAGRRLGPGLIAEDLAEALPDILGALR